MTILCTIDLLTREVSLPAGQCIAAYDHNVDVIRFQAEPIEDFSLNTSSIKIAAQGPNNVRHDYAVDPSTVSIEEETGYITFDWPIPAGVTEMPIGTFKYSNKGQLIFSVCAEIIDGSTVSQAWHSDDGIITVVAHLEPEAGGGEDPEEEATNAQKIAQLQTNVAVINTQVGALANGSPTPVATVAEMTDESAVYLYTGSESGYTADNWYYYNGSAWTSGGTYGGATTSTTFTEHGVPADDFAVGEALADLGEALADLKEEVNATTICKNLIGMEVGVLYPVFIKAGTKLTISTSDGSNFPSSPSNILYLYLYDKDGNRTDYFGLATGQPTRVITTNASGADTYYLAWNQQYPVPLQVEIGDSKTDYTEYFPPVKRFYSENKSTKRGLYGKTVVTFGDSRTWYDGKAYVVNTTVAGQICKGYQFWMRKYLQCVIDNQGKSGYTSPQMCAVVHDADLTNADVVTLAGGINDFLHNIPIGTIGAVGGTFDATTVYGATQVMIEDILSKKPSVKLMLINPFTGWINNDADEYPDTYANVKRNLAELYHLPILDLARSCGFNALNRNTFYCDDMTKVSYRLHLNDLGNEVIGHMIASFVGDGY